MHWKHKALLQLVFSHVPLGDRLNYLAQRHVTRTLPNSDDKFRTVLDKAKTHLELLDRHSSTDLRHCTFYEFGVGSTLAIPLAFFAHGVERQVVCDIRPLVRPFLVADALDKLRRMHPCERLERLPCEHLQKRSDLLAVLQQECGIEYRAPEDARRTSLPAESVDCLTSSNAIEHIPASDIPAILRECRRLLRPGGVMSFRIDYQDHYSYSDPSISAYNFLRFSEQEWSRFNPPLHYQNRLRHRDHVGMAIEAGFEVVEELPSEGSKEDLESIATLPLGESFRRYSPAELAVRNAFVVLRKPHKPAASSA